MQAQVSIKAFDKMMRSIKKLTGALVLALTGVMAHAKINLPVIFQSNMVLQRDKAATIWGFGDAGEKLLLSFNGKETKTVTDKTGRWSIKLSPQQAGGPYTITIKGSSNSIELKNILFGERKIASLEAQLKEARESIKIVTEDFESTREELQSANEEVLSSNEELQSINEELETSNEELQ